MDKILFDIISLMHKFVVSDKKWHAMRKTFLAITLFLAFSKAALAQFGNCTASEMRTYVDSATGNTITMLTDTMKNDRFLGQRIFRVGKLSFKRIA